MSKTSRRCIVALAACLALIAVGAGPALAAPTADFSWTPAAPKSGLAVTFTSSSTAAPLSTITTQQWDFDNDGSIDATGATAEHTFATSGDHQVKLVVTSDELIGNQATATKTVTVTTRPPTAAFTFAPLTPSVGDLIQFASNASDPDGDQLAHAWNFGDGSGPSTVRNPTHIYDDPGTKTVRLTVNDGHGGTAEVLHDVVVRDPSAATASFEFTPTAPREGQVVTFTSTSQPSAKQSITDLDWDLDSDGQFDDDHGKTATRRFDSRGVYRVALRVRQKNGNESIAEGSVRVTALAATPPPPGGTVTPPDDTPQAPTAGSARLLTPFPIVRLVGKAFPRRTVVTILGVRAPKRSLVRVRCKGHGCPKVVRRKRSRGRPLRFKTFERSLPAGARIEVFVVRAERIGKFTRFKLRRNTFPLRTDLCVMPGKRKPRPCPS